MELDPVRLPPKDLLFLALPNANPMTADYPPPLESEPLPPCDKLLALAGDGAVIKLLVLVGMGGRLLLDIVLALLLEFTDGGMFYGLTLIYWVC